MSSSKRNTYRSRETCCETLPSFKERTFWHAKVCAITTDRRFVLIKLMWSLSVKGRHPAKRSLRGVIRNATGRCIHTFLLNIFCRLTIDGSSLFHCKLQPSFAGLYASPQKPSDLTLIKFLITPRSLAAYLYWQKLLNQSEVMEIPLIRFKAGVRQAVG